MWDLGNLWTEGSKSTAMDASPSVASFSYLQVMNEIHVLLVDHDSDGPMNTAKLLESCQYRVTFVELASSAVTMLTNGKVKYDIVMANVNSPDLHGYKLLQEATKMNIPIIFMSIDDNAFMAMKAIESGAFLYIKKPATKEMMSCLWQHVTREKTKMMMIRERDGLAGPTNYSIARGVEFREVTQHHHAGDQNPNNAYGNNMNNMLVTKDNKGKAGKIFNMGGNAVVGDENLYDSEDIMMLINHNNKIKRKVCTEWTQELHEKFMEAVEQLGEGRCFPKEILELMDVPGLTRMQVASHLQKCRNDNWRSPEERKASLAAQTVSSDSGGSQYKPRRFGSMPRLGKAGGAPSASYQTIQEANGVGQGSKTLSQSETANESHVGNMGIGSIVVANDNAPRRHLHQQPQQINYGGSPSVNAAAAAAAPPTPAVQMYPPNPRQHPPADDFFSFQDMDCLIQNFQGNMPPQGSAAAGAAGMVNVPNSGGYHYDPVYHHEQNRNKVGSHWSSDTSNFESDESENRGRR